MNAADKARNRWGTERTQREAKRVPAKAEKPRKVPQYVVTALALDAAQRGLTQKQAEAFNRKARRGYESKRRKELVAQIDDQSVRTIVVEAFRLEKDIFYVLDGSKRRADGKIDLKGNLAKGFDPSGDSFRRCFPKPYSAEKVETAWLCYRDIAATIDKEWQQLLGSNLPRSA